MKINSIWVIVILVGLLFISCEDKEKKQLAQKASSLEKKLKERDKAYNSIIEVMTEIEDQINTIKSRESLIALDGNGDFTKKKKGNLVKDLNEIDELILRSSETIATLNAKLESSNLNLGSIRRKLSKLTNALRERESSLTQLKEKLAQKDEEIGELTAKVGGLSLKVQVQLDSLSKQNQRLEERTKDLYTAYYIVNSEKKLKEDGLILKKGFLSKNLEVQPDVELDRFTAINIKETKMFIIDGSKAEVITDHPSGSYQLVNEGNKIKYLEVLDEEAFWQISKYLIISKKG